MKYTEEYLSSLEIVDKSYYKHMKLPDGSMEFCKAESASLLKHTGGQNLFIERDTTLNVWDISCAYSGLLVTDGDTRKEAIDNLNELLKAEDFALARSLGIEKYGLSPRYKEKEVSNES